VRDLRCGARGQKEKKTKDKDAGGGGDVDTEISEANALRASLGLKPLANVDEWKGKKK
jgi:hypothetical protein